MKKQKRTLKTTGSFINWMMGNNATLPKTGEGATELLWSDRHAYEVTWVSDDSTECKIQRYNPKRIDNLGMSDCQTYEYKELHGPERHIVWRKKQGGCWCFKGKEIRYTKKYLDQCPTFMPSQSLTQEQRDQVYEGDIMPKNEVEGITKAYTTYSPVNIIFGTKDEHYDFSF